MATILKVVSYGDAADPRYRVERLRDGERAFLDYGLKTETEALTSARDAAERMGAYLEEGYAIRTNNPNVRAWVLAPAPF